LAFSQPETRFLFKSKLKSKSVEITLFNKKFDWNNLG